MSFLMVDVTGTIAPARELGSSGDKVLSGDEAVRILLANLNLLVPVASAILVILVAFIFICFFRRKEDDMKGKLIVKMLYICIKGTIAPPQGENSLRALLPWVPAWVDLNMVVPVAATVVVVFFGIVVICVAWSRRRPHGQTRLRGC